MSLVLATFAFLLLLMFVMGIPCNMGLSWVPSIIREIYPYGKTSDGILRSSIVKAILVPKSWFSHFYLFSVLYSLEIVIILSLKYFFQWEEPSILRSYLDLVSYHKEKPLCDATSSLLAATLFFIHVSRRLYESLRVTIYSGAQMNLVHYVAGFTHYWGCTTVLLTYSPGFTNQGMMDIHYWHSVGILVFLFGQYNQYVAHSKLASFRKDPQNKKGYFIARGGLFEYVSCPNFLSEIIIYISLHMILGFAHYPWTLITVWVITNQTLAATMSHKWYLTKFEDYPKSRRAIIPFIY